MSFGSFRCSVVIFCCLKTQYCLIPVNDEASWDALAVQVAQQFCEVEAEAESSTERELSAKLPLLERGSHRVVVRLRSALFSCMRSRRTAPRSHGRTTTPNGRGESFPLQCPGNLCDEMIYTCVSYSIAALPTIKYKTARHIKKQKTKALLILTAVMLANDH